MATVKRSARVMVVVDDWQRRLRRRFVIGVGACCMVACFAAVCFGLSPKGVTEIFVSCVVGWIVQ